MEDDERPEDALQRELLEELGIVARSVAYVCTLLHRAEEVRKIHYFAVESWEGEILIREGLVRDSRSRSLAVAFPERAGHIQSGH